jgi:hypothetical protein
MTDWLDLWYQAQAQEYGLGIPCENQRDVARMLYKARNKNPDLANVRVCFMPNGEVWLVKATMDSVK